VIGADSFSSRYKSGYLSGPATVLLEVVVGWGCGGRDVAVRQNLHVFRWS